VRSARINDPDNLTGACISCNSSKGSKPLGEGEGEWTPPSEQWGPGPGASENWIGPGGGGDAGEAYHEK
jgi:hypothetical protein